MTRTQHIGGLSRLILLTIVSVFFIEDKVKSRGKR